MTCNYLGWAICLALLLAAAPAGLGQTPVNQPEELVVIYITAVEELDDGENTRQILSEPRLTTRFGRPTKLQIGGQVLDGDEYIDIGHKFEFLPTKRAGKDAIWVEMRTESTDYVKDKEGNGQPVVAKETLTGKYQLGKKNITRYRKSALEAGRSFHLEFRIETKTLVEYERMLTEDAAAAKSRQRE